MTVRIDGAALASVLRGPNGPVARRLIEDGELVKEEAKRLVGVSDPAGRVFLGSSNSRKSGQLRDSIVKRFEMDGDNLRVVVGSDDPIALWHHEGTEPHKIPKAGTVKVLVFPSRRGYIAFIPASRQPINHPGTQPNRYLTNALQVLRQRYA